MRGSLRGVRSRVERIAGQVVWDGCYVCREDEARTRFSWVDWRTGTVCTDRGLSIGVGGP